ncbi:hypothetical protein [Geotalea sp. SG265]|uniref:hypothetical protein n=1 Tax=Geotalea sp. SG265 TaxID=2922867 RepID=UPI001FAEA0E2|nr:hypothetical protein [Geotalea sp. SG265]
MALTSNETAWATMTVALLISMAWAALMTWIAIRAQHTKSIPEVQEAIKKIFVRLLLWVSNGCAAFVLVSELQSTEPINRRDIFLIVWSVSMFLLSLILKLAKALLNTTELQGKFAELQGRMIEHDSQIVDFLKAKTGKEHNQEDAPGQ